MKKWIDEHVFLIDAIFFFGLFPLTYVAYLYKQELWKNEFIIALLFRVYPISIMTRQSSAAWSFIKILIVKKNYRVALLIAEVQYMCVFLPPIWRQAKYVWMYISTKQVLTKRKVQSLTCIQYQLPCQQYGYLQVFFVVSYTSLQGRNSL